MRVNMEDYEYQDGETRLWMYTGNRSGYVSVDIAHRESYAYIDVPIHTWTQIIQRVRQSYFSEVRK